MVHFRSLTLGFALLSSFQSASAAEELTPERFKELTTSGKNGMIKFYQPWCGHCTAMKPAWDDLAKEAHPSVFIADVNCSEQEELCSENGVAGYPTIKIYKGGADPTKAENYEGARSLPELLSFVDENLAVKCDITDPDGSGCSDKAKDFIKKWTAKGDLAAVAKERARLEGMAASSMKSDLKKWLNERTAILRQIAENCDVKNPQTTCSEKAVEYIGKWKDKDADSVKKELDRLEKMTSDVMTDDLRQWLKERISILKQFIPVGGDEL